MAERVTFVRRRGVGKDRAGSYFCPERMLYARKREKGRGQERWGRGHYCQEKVGIRVQKG